MSSNSSGGKGAYRDQLNRRNRLTPLGHHDVAHAPLQGQFGSLGQNSSTALSVESSSSSSQGFSQDSGHWHAGSPNSSGLAPAARLPGARGGQRLDTSDTILPKVVVVGVKMKAHRWKSSQPDITAEGKELLEYALNNLVLPGDTIMAVAISLDKPAGTEVLRETYNVGLTYTLENQITTLTDLGRAKNVAVEVRVPNASSVQGGLVTEAMKHGHDKVILLLGASKWSSKDLGALYAKELPENFKVMMVRSRNLIDSKKGERPLQRGNSLPYPYDEGFIAPDPMARAERAEEGVGSMMHEFLPPTEQPYTYEELMDATSSFSHELLLGEGGCGAVYLGMLQGGTKVAVKCLKGLGERQANNGLQQMATEFKVLRKVNHKNLTALRGICVGEYHCLLVYDFLPNGSLDNCLHDPAKPVLTWTQRMKIALSAAEGFKYLHEYCRPPIIHRDIKAANILLDDNLEAQVTDFGLAKLIELGPQQTPVATQIMGTRGYVAPEYLAKGTVDFKIDVYSFGVVLLEIVTGHLPFDRRRNPVLLTEWARPRGLSDQWHQLVDHRLGDNYNMAQHMRVCQLAFLCVDDDPRVRPTMAEVVRYLEMT